MPLTPACPPFGEIVVDLVGPGVALEPLPELGFVFDARLVRPLDVVLGSELRLVLESGVVELPERVVAAPSAKTPCAASAAGLAR